MLRALRAILIGLSLWNAAAAMQPVLHWPADDEWSRMDRNLANAKRVLSALPRQRVEYRTEGATESYDASNFYRLRYILAPAILTREPEKYVFVEFWTTKRVAPIAGLQLVKDLGYGFGLYRRP